MLHRFTTPLLFLVFLFSAIGALFPFTALASVQVITGATNAVPAGTGTRYTPIGGYANTFGSDSNTISNTIMPIGGTFSNLRVQSEYVPGTTATVVVTLRKNSVNTTLTCTITSAVTTCSNLANSVTVAQGDKVTWSINYTTAVAAGRVSMAMDFTPTTANDTFFITQITGPSATLEVYGALTSYGAANSSPTTNVKTMFPEAGVLSRLTASSTAPGAGTAFDYTVMNNQASTTLTCQINGNAPNWCSDNTNTVSIAAGDFQNLAIVPTNSPTIAELGAGVRFLPTVVGNFDFINGITTDSSTVEFYRPIQGLGASVTQASTTQVVNHMTITGMLVKINTAVTGAQTRVFSIHKNTATTTATCTVSTGGSATSCSWTGELVVADGDVLNTSDFPTGAPTASIAYVSLIANRNVPTVTTKAATSITATTVTLNATSTALGGGNVTDAGFAWGTNLTMNGDTATTTATSGSTFSSTPTDVTLGRTSLTCGGTTYYFRPYATNADGTGYGTITSFVTGTCVNGPPTVSTQAASSITQITATLNGTIVALNGANVTVSGFAYGLTSSLASPIATTTGSGAFSSAPSTFSTSTASVAPLSCNTLYYFRPYATNSNGDGLGSIETFTTSACIPTVTTQAASSITPTSAILNGTITALGGANVTVSGFAYGINSTLATVVATTTSSGAFSSEPSTFIGTTTAAFLSCNTLYYFRPYAANSSGNGLGSIQSFTTGTCALTPYFTPARTSGVAPLAVFFDAASTTDAGITNIPFHEVDYAWDFGDISAGVWTYGTASSSKNVAYGPEVGHVFETLGTYTVTMTAKDGTNTAATTTTITVTDPATVLTTYCFYNTTLGTGCTGTGVATSTFASAVNMYVDTNRRLLFKAGDIFTGPAGAILSSAGPGIIGAYGTANEGRAIVRTNASGMLLYTGTPVPNDWRVMDLEFDGQSAQNVQALFSNTGINQPNQFTMLRLWAHDIGGAFDWAPNNSAQSYVPEQFFVVDSKVQRISGYHGVYGAFRQSALIGNLFDDSTTGTAEHLIRIQFMDRGYINQNQIQSVAATKEVIALRTTCSSNPICNSNSYFPNMGLTGSNATTRKVVLSDNAIVQGTNTSGGGIAVSPPLNGDSSSISDIILERNYYTTTAGTAARQIIVAGNGITIRNEIINNTVNTGSGGIAVSGPNIMGTSTDIRIYNNTIYTTNNTSNFNLINLGSSSGATTTNVAVKNNLGYAPNATTPGMLGDWAAGQPTGNTSIYNSTDSQVKNTSPLFTNASGATSTPTDFQLSVGSYAIGTTTPFLLGVLYDFARTLRPTNPSMGAFEYTVPAAPTVTTQAASSLTQTTATLNGNITATGGANATVRGFAYGTSATLATTIATTTDTVGQPFSTGAYTGDVASLTCGTTYYVRPYATNSAGDGLGTIETFTTSVCPVASSGGGSSSQNGWITVINTVINDNGGTKIASGFPLFVKDAVNGNLTSVVSGVATTFYTAGLYPYYITETTSPQYTHTFSGNCDSTGLLNLAPDNYATCTITNNDIASATSTAFATSTLSSAIPAPNPSGLSSVQVQAILNLLTSFGVDQATIVTVTTILTGSPNSSSASAGTASGTFTFTRNLQLHQTGADVRALQQYLNSHGFVIAQSGAGSPGHETTYFGLATYRTLVRFQKAKGITPAAGYFGPLTRKVMENVLQ